MVNTDVVMMTMHLENQKSSADTLKNLITVRNLDKSFYNLVSGNMANHNNITGIRLWFSNNNTITENSANNNTYYGIHLTNSSNNLIANNSKTLNNNRKYGIFIRRPIPTEINSAPTNTSARFTGHNP